MAAEETEWDSYLTRIEDQPASIALDLALADEAPLEDKSWLLWVSIKLQTPDKEGFTSDTESETLSIIEDAIATNLDIIGAILVGRVKSNGLWDIYFYSPTNEEFDDIVLEVMEGYPEYLFATDTNEDPEWDEYFGNLYPDYYEYQCMLNRRVIDALNEQNDNAAAKRPIDHLINFPDEKSRASFLKDVEKDGYVKLSAGEKTEDENLPYPLNISRDDNTIPEELNTSIWKLCQLAEKYNGHYDGWGCEAVK